VKTTRYLGAVYRAELAAELQKAGYALRHGRDGFFELAHIDRAQLEAFSRRAAQIEQRLAAGGLTRDTATSDQTQLAALATRQRKVSAERQALHAEWRQRAREVGIDFGRREPAIEREPGLSEKRPPTAPEGARRSVRFAVSHLTERQAGARSPPDGKAPDALDGEDVVPGTCRRTPRRIGGLTGAGKGT
jgi:hypothetical protein